MPDEVVIRVEDVSKDFVLPHEKINSLKGLFTGAAKGRNKGKETQHALKNISFEIKKGEFFGIVGRNGSGKSTLLKILASIYQPTMGKVYTHGKLVPFIELGVGFNPELTGRENVYLNGALLGFSQKEVAAMYECVVAFAELERFMDQKLKNYSSGMQVRLAFSMAVRANADILLVDEVLAVGDADFQRKCFEYFSQLKKDETTVIFVSHNMDAVREYCDRAILIEKSNIIAAGTADKIATQYSRLFAPKDDRKDATASTTRWGNNKVTHSKVSVQPTVAKQDDKNIVLSVQYQAKATVSHPIFGFRIKKHTGEALMGSNTQIARLETGDFKAGDKGEMIWTIPNIFEDGKYLVDLDISDSSGLTHYDSWEDAASFVSFRENHTPYGVSPLVNVKHLR